MSQVWWENFFDATLADFLLERDDQKQLDLTANFLIDTLELNTDSIVFDQCCGTGDVSCALARKNINVIGVDQSEIYIQRANKKAEDAQLPCVYEVGDALTYIPKIKCDAAFNWYTSFGYSEDDHVNIKMIESISQSLKSGGKFILDYLNVPSIFKNFLTANVIRKTINNQDVTLVRESKVDLERGMLMSRWNFYFPDGTQKTTFGESRLYTPREFKKMLQTCGFEEISFMGDLNGSILTKDSPRCIVTARKI